MKTVLNVAILAVLLLITANPCFAEMSIMHVSMEQATALKMEIRSKPNGPNEVWVELEFPTEGPLKNFSHVSLEIREGEKFLLGCAALREKRSSSGNVVVNFMANRAYLDKLSLMVVVGHPMDMTGYELRLKDFAVLEKVR